jgi:hypothetical protein
VRASGAPMRSMRRGFAISIFADLEGIGEQWTRG